MNGLQNKLRSGFWASCLTRHGFWAGLTRHCEARSAVAIPCVRQGRPKTPYFNGVPVFALALLLPALAAAAPVLAPPKNGGIYVVAHRGVHDNIPENTLPAYEKAIEIGADFVEIDVRKTRDGRLVCIHNNSIEGYVEGLKDRVKDMPFDTLRALDFGIRVGPQWKGTHIPTYEEALDTCRGRIGVYLDVKDATLEELIPPIRERGMERQVIWYIATPVAVRLRKACPECIPMPDPFSAKGLPALLEKVKPQVVASSWGVFDAQFAAACHAAGAIAIVDDEGPESWAKLVEWGVDGIQTDHVQQLIDWLKANPRKTP